jgi:hypothetical protein
METHPRSLAFVALSRAAIVRGAHCGARDSSRDF